MPRPSWRKLSLAFILGWLLPLLVASPGITQQWCSQTLEVRQRLVSQKATKSSQLEAVVKCEAAAIPALARLLGDSEGGIRQEAAMALMKIAKQLPGKASNLSESEVKKINTLAADSKKLQEALGSMDAAKVPLDENTVREIRLSYTALQDRLENLKKSSAYQVREWLNKNPWVWGVGAYLVTYLAIFAVRPLWLLKLDDILKPITLKLPWLNWELSPRVLLFLKYHPRVLDAWVKAHIDLASQNFQSKETVSEREIYISVPVAFDDKSQSKRVIEEFKSKDLKNLFDRQRFCLLIWGEGGSGKTSLVCQIGKWAMAKDSGMRPTRHQMIPVIIEQELALNGGSEQSLLKAIDGQLQYLIGTSEPLSEELLARLLRKRRVLVIVDRLSEMSSQTRKQIRPDAPDFPVKALIVTSRIQETLGDAIDGTIETLRIDGKQLSGFIFDYLKQQGKRDLFEQRELFDACTKLSDLVEERKSITVLLAKLYAEQLINSKENPHKSGQKPDTIPDLILNYVKESNQKAEREMGREYPNVFEDAKQLAWNCLEKSYKPQPTDSQSFHEAYLDYFEKRLCLIRRVGIDGGQIRFALDPIAEYLAGLHLIDLYGKDEQQWHQFIEGADTKAEKLEEIKGFLLAVRDCCLARTGIPEFVSEELGKKAGLDPEALEEARRERIIKDLIADLSKTGDKKRVLEAITRLGEEFGEEAKEAVPALVKLFKDKDEEIAEKAAASLSQMGTAAKPALISVLPEVKGKRQSLAVQTLRKIGLSAEAVSGLITVLEDGDEEVEFRLAAVSALAEFGLEAKEAVPILLKVLEDEREPVPIRQQIAGTLNILRLRGLEVEQPIPTAIAKIQGENLSLRLEVIESWRENLDKGVLLEMVDIPGGTFLMGAPEGEGSDRERPQHSVTVEPFSMGKYPITQAQWQAIASRSDLKVERDLNPNPSWFKGYNRPVEQVNWYDAIEFCGRLSKLTGREYRLPSEAEWEYACRAGTTTAYHFGESITPEVANYDRKSRETTPVGSFGVANAFGLYEMHGNVWEWCSDDWHGNYQGAPEDGSAWLSVGESSTKVLRGGSWFNRPNYCRSASRSSYYPGHDFNDIGLRVVCAAPRTLAPSAL